MSDRVLGTLIRRQSDFTPTPRRSDAIPPNDWPDSDPERAAARWLPDEYAALRSMPAIRIMELINRCWGRYSDGDRRQLGQALLAVLAPLDRAGSKATPEIRQLCERVVLQWRERILTRTYANGKERAG